MDEDRTFCFFPRDPETAAGILEILGLPPDMEYVDAQVTFGTDEVGIVTVKILPTGEQVVALALLACRQQPDLTPAEVDHHDCVDP